MTIAPTRTTPPDWLVEYATSFADAESHAFILHGDVEGLAFEAIGQRDLLLAHLAKTRAIVARFDLARGITIERADQPVPGAPGPNPPTRRERALAIAGLDDAPQGGGSLTGLLGGIGPGGGGGDPFAQATSPGAAFPLLQRLLLGGQPAEVAVVIDYADQVVPAAGPGGLAPPDRAALVSLLAWARDSRIEQDQQVLFLLTRELVDLHPALRAADAGWRPVAMPLPDGAARAAWLAWYLAYRERADKPIALADGLTVREVATLSAGLSLRNLEDVLLTSAAAGGLTRLGLQAVKDRIIATSYADVAAMLDPLAGGLDTLGGLAPVKAWLRERLIAPLRDGRTQDVPKGVMFVGPPGCLAGDTILRLNRAGKGFAAPITTVVARFTGAAPHGRAWDPAIPTYVQYAEGDRVRLTRVINAWVSGVKATFALVTTDGRRIRATDQHPFRTPTGWKTLGDLAVGDEVLVNVGRGTAGRGPKRRYPATYTRYHPYQRRAKDGFRCPTHHLAAEATLNGLTFAEYVAVLRTEPARAATLTFLSPGTVVHHEDNDPVNNAPGNLIVARSQADHAAMHGWGDNVLERIGVATIASIVATGVEPTYDIEVAADEACFLANGFVVHNTGKTLLARALARETGFGAIAVKMDRLLDKYVGGSERNMARLFSFARALAPCIMFIDEVDQSDLATRGGNSGNPVASNLFSSLIQFAGDPANRGRVILLFATNRPDLLDPALIRDERIDAVIPILLPERDDRRLIALAQAAMQGTAIDGPALDLIAERTDRYSAAAIGSVVREARLLAGGVGIRLSHALDALDDLRPTGTGPEADLFTLQAVKAVNKRSLLPPRYRDLLVKRENIDQAIADARTALPDGPRSARQAPDLRW